MNSLFAICSVIFRIRFLKNSTGDDCCACKLVKSERLFTPCVKTNLYRMHGFSHGNNHESMYLLKIFWLGIFSNLSNLRFQK
jgi:hypothetical protein